MIWLGIGIIAFFAWIQFFWDDESMKCPDHNVKFKNGTCKYCDKELES